MQYKMEVTTGKVTRVLVVAVMRDKPIHHK